MTDTKQKKFNLSAAQVLAGALAAVTAAVLGSQVGVGGTLAGAALGSIITTIAAAIYQHSLERSSERMRALARRPGRPTAADAVTVPIPKLTPEAAARGAPPPHPSAPDPRQLRRRFALAAAGTLAAFTLSMIAVTGVEALRGEPLSGGNGTTVQQVIDRAPQTSSTNPQPTSTPRATPTRTPTGTSTLELPTSPAPTVGATSPPPSAAATRPPASTAPTATSPGG